jgi:GT2 family glycosyltransferase
VSIILVSWNTRELLLTALGALPEAIGSLEHEVWVVDNGSADGSAEAVRASFPKVKLVARRENLGFASASNRAIEASSGRYVLLLNSDTVALGGSIEQLVRFADGQPSVGVVGAVLLNPDGSFQFSYADFPSIWGELLSATGLGRKLIRRAYPSYGPERSQQARRVDYVSGACLLARRAAVDQVGPLDEGYFMYSEEVDWCRRMRRAGWEVWFLPTKILHHGGGSTRQQREQMLTALYRSKVRYFERHHGRRPAAALRASLVVLLQIRWLAWVLFERRRGERVRPQVGWRDLAGSRTAARANSSGLPEAGRLPSRTDVSV